MALFKRTVQSSSADELMSIFRSPGEDIRKAKAQRLYDYYVGDQAMVRDYTMRAMSRTFKSDTIDKMQLPYRLFVKKIVNRLSLAYKYPPVRYLEQESQDERYQELLAGSNLVQRSKDFNRLAKLLDTVYVTPVWRKDHIDFDIIPPHLITVRESDDNYLEPVAVLIPIAYGPHDMRFIYWSEKENYALNRDGERVQDERNIMGKNPYGVLPFVPCRLHDTEDHWGEGDTQLVDVNEEANILLSSTFYNAIMQSHGQPVAVNMNFDPKRPPVLGPDNILAVEDVSKDDMVPSFTYAKASADIAGCLSAIDWMAKTAAIDRGLPPASISIDTKDQSGYSKEIDNMELMETRQDDIESLRMFEKKLFRVAAAVWNFHMPSKRIDLDQPFGIDFEDPEIPASVEDEIKEKEFEYKYGISSPVDEVVDEDAGIDEAKALQIILKNRDLLSQIRPAPVVQPQQEEEQEQPFGGGNGQEY